MNIKIGGIYKLNMSMFIINDLRMELKEQLVKVTKINGDQVYHIIINDSKQLDRIGDLESAEIGWFERKAKEVK